MTSSSMTPLGTCSDIQKAFPHAPTSRYRLEFTHDVRAKEMRWVLFTAAKRGAIGKLIFTIGQPNYDENGTFSLSAHIKSISVTSQYRGYGLARVLYLACLSTLAELRVTQLDLEAEEDTKRHGKLVRLYQHWGFQPIPNAKILFLYNQNDCFRKVPMSLSFGARPLFVPSRLQKETWFCMITLRSMDGTCLIPSENGMIQPQSLTGKAEDGLWQTLLGSHGEIYLRSVYGKFLCVEDSGAVLADRPWHSTWETFQVVPYPDADTVALRDFHGNYLSMNQQMVQSSRIPTPWDGGEAIKALVSTQQDAPPLYATILRKYQTQSFVQGQYRKYGRCNHATMSIPKALEALMVLTGDTESTGQSWVLHHLLATAEAARDDGHPDWFQLILFLRGFGMLFLLWTDEENDMLRSISPSEWLVLMSTWITGHVIPSQIPYPELNTLNADHCTAEAENDRLEIDIETITLPWTPDEYLYTVLKRNATSLPTEALTAVRLWCLRLWYQDNCYESLGEEETKEWLQSVTRYTSSPKEKMKAIIPEQILPYYLELAHKYLPDALEW